MDETLLPAIEQAYHQYQHRPALTATFLAERMLESAGVAPGDPQYFAEHARYRSAAGDWLWRKFDPTAA